MLPESFRCYLVRKTGNDKIEAGIEQRPLRELAAGEIAQRFDVTRPAISQHLTVLREAGLLEERRSGPRRLYRARPSGTTELRAWLEQFWDDGLARLRSAAEREEQ